MAITPFDPRAFAALEATFVTNAEIGSCVDHRSHSAYEPQTEQRKAYSQGQVEIKATWDLEYSARRWHFNFSCATAASALDALILDGAGWDWRE